MFLALKRGMYRLCTSQIFGTAWSSIWMKIFENFKNFCEISRI